jgi:hypothetical protein
VDLTDALGVMASTADRAPLTFDITSNFTNLNCILGKLWFKSSQDEKSSVRTRYACALIACA